MRRFIRLALLTGLLAATGCGGCTEKPAGRISYEIRHKHGASKGQLDLTQGWAAVGEGAGQLKIEVKGNQLRALGKDYGSVAPGDVVVLDETDGLTVNGEKREPR